MTSTYADESQSGFRMFNELADDTVDVAVNWATFSPVESRRIQVRLQLRGAQARLPLAAFSLHPHHDTEGGRRQPALQQHLPPEQILSRATSAPRCDSTRNAPTDAYEGDQTTTAGYGMVDIAMIIARD